MIISVIRDGEGCERRGYFGVGIVNTKTAANVGVLWRSADLLGASFIFTVGRRYKREPSDTMKSWRHIPLLNFSSLDDLWDHLPFDCRVVGVELQDDAKPLAEYRHWQRAIYLLGAEDHGLTPEAIERCHDLIVLPGRRSMNVSVAGSIVLYDRWTRTSLVKSNGREVAIAV